MPVADYKHTPQTSPRLNGGGHPSTDVEQLKKATDELIRQSNEYALGGSAPIKSGGETPTFYKKSK